MAEIIFTADDFGVIDSLNEGIIDLAKQGIINSVEVLTNYGSNGEGSLKNVKRLLKEVENSGHSIELGVHLTITSGKPLTEDSGLLPILDEDGNFKTFGNTCSGALDQALYNELATQIKVLKNNAETEKYLTHLTIHHDSLWFFENYTTQLMQICKDFGNLPVRNPRSNPADKNLIYSMLAVPVKSLLKIPFQDIKEIQRMYLLRKNGKFPGKEISFYSTSYMDSSFYGPIPAFEVDAYEKAKEIKNKGKVLEQIMKYAAKEQNKTKKKNDPYTGPDITEIMFHLRKGEINGGNELFASELNKEYNGIDPKYFDGRAIEYEGLRFYKDIPALMQKYGHIKGSWKSAGTVTFKKK